MSSLELARMGSLVYPIMLAQEAGEISEGKAGELLGLDIVTYREKKLAAINAIVAMLDSLPSPLILLLDATKDRPKS